MGFEIYVTSLEHIGIPTAKLDKTVFFYESLGFKLLHRTLNPETNERVVFLGMAGVVIETYDCASPSGVNGGVDHFALAVTDVEGAWNAAKAMGCALLDNAIQSMPFWENGVRFFTILGPNHEKVEFLQKC